MDTTVTEIAPDIYRLSTWAPSYGIQFNQFLIRDDEPTLVHTAFRKLFPTTRAAVATLLDPARLRWVGYSHFEPDECGALNEWLAVAPQAEAVCGFVGAHVMLADFADRPPRVLADDEVVATGRHRLRYLRTPHVPHCWDAGLLFDETTRTLFCSDLFFHPGNPEPLIDTDIVSPARLAMEKSRSGPMAHDVPYTPYTDGILHRLGRLAPETLAVMHGSSFTGDGAAALRDLSTVFRELLAGEAVP
jgi:flavorubredoxin